MNKERYLERLGVDESGLEIRLKGTRAVTVMALGRQNGVMSKFLAIGGETYFRNTESNGMKVPWDQVVIRMEDGEPGSVKKTWNEYLSARKG